jgi:hypothetical protein
MYHKHFPSTGIHILPHLVSMQGPISSNKYYLQTNLLTIVSNRSCWALCWWIPTQILQFLKEKHHVHWYISTKINEEHTSLTSKEYFTSSCNCLGRNTVPTNMTYMRGTINKVNSQVSPADDWTYFLHLPITELPKCSITLGRAQSCYNETLLHMK